MVLKYPKLKTNSFLTNSKHDLIWTAVSPLHTQKVKKEIRLLSFNPVWLFSNQFTRFPKQTLFVLTSTKTNHLAFANSPVSPFTRPHKEEFFFSSWNNTMNKMRMRVESVSYSLTNSTHSFSQQQSSFIKVTLVWHMARTTEYPVRIKLTT